MRKNSGVECLNWRMQKQKIGGQLEKRQKCVISQFVKVFFHLCLDSETFHANFDTQQRGDLHQVPVERLLHKFQLTYNVHIVTYAMNYPRTRAFMSGFV